MFSPLLYTVKIVWILFPVPFVRAVRLFESSTHVHRRTAAEQCSSRHLLVRRNPEQRQAEEEVQKLQLTGERKKEADRLTRRSASRSSRHDQIQ